MAGKKRNPTNTFAKDKKVQKEAVEKAKTPEAKAKNGAKKSMQGLLSLNQDIIQLKRDIIIGYTTTPDKDGKIWLERYIKNCFDEAEKDPNSRISLQLATSIFGQNFIQDIYADKKKQQQQNVDFARWRISQMLFDKQKEVFENHYDKMIEVICSRRAGKTILNSRLLVSRCLDPNTLTLYINLTFQNAIEQMFDEVVAVAEAIDFPIKTKSKNEGIIIFENGSSVEFGGNSNNAEADKYRGFHYKLVVIDEIGHQRNCNYFINDVLFMSLRDYSDYQIVLSGTPNRIPHQYAERLWEDPAVKHYHWTFKDNPIIPNKESVIPDFCATAGVEENSSIVQREMLGLMGAYDTEAQVFRGAKTYKTIPQSFKPDKIYIGIDYGCEDYNAIVPVLVDSKLKQCYVYNPSKFHHSNVEYLAEQIIKSRNDVIAYAKKINRDFDEYNCKVITDTNEPMISQSLVDTYKIPRVFKAYKYDRDPAIELLAQYMRTDKIYIPENSMFGEEIESTVFIRDPDTDAIIHKIDDSIYHPDLMFALLYTSRQIEKEVIAPTYDGQSKWAKEYNSTRPEWAQ